MDRTLLLALVPFLPALLRVAAQVLMTPASRRLRRLDRLAETRAKIGTNAPGAQDLDRAIGRLAKQVRVDAEVTISRRIDPHAVVGIVIFGGLAVGLVAWGLSADIVWARVLLTVLAAASGLMLAGPINTFWKAKDED